MHFIGLQWVYNNQISSSDESIRTFDFPLSFPSTCYCAVPSPISTSGMGDIIVQINAISRTQYIIIKNNLGNTGNYVTSFFLIAMGI